MNQEHASPRASLEADLEALRADLGKLREDVAALTASLAELVGESASGEKVREMAARLAERAKQTGRENLDALQRKIEERPLTSIAVAFGLGLVIGKLLER